MADCSHQCIHSIIVNKKDTLLNLIEKYKQEIASLEQGNYYFSECEYECEQARKSKLEEVVDDLKQIIKQFSEI
jgi:hypothetical protein